MGDIRKAIEFFVFRLCPRLSFRLCPPQRLLGRVDLTLAAPQRRIDAA